MKNKQCNFRKFLLSSPIILHWQAPFAFVILPIINLLTLCLADPLRENISYLTNALGYRFLGILWACTCAFYLFIYTLRFAYLLFYPHKMGIFLLGVSTLGMIVSVVIPYVPDIYPALATLHINLSMIATLLYVLVTFHILMITYYREPTLITQLLPYYLCIVGSCLLFFFLMACVTTLLEVLFVIPMGFFLYKANKEVDVIKKKR